ncbi:MAG TPA: hypothetical protein VHY35_02520 [Stellaceae bacterium]|nr:hypothetical protein [Stellaceae bacterium]
MTNRFKTLAVAAILAASTSGAALAQTYTCPAGYWFDGRVCRPNSTPGSVVGGAVVGAGNVAGTAVNAAGNVAGSAVNAAGSIVGATVGAVTGR